MDRQSKIRSVVRKCAKNGALVALLYFTVGWLLFRMPFGAPQVIESEVRFKYLDFHFDMPRDLVWEIWPWGGSNLYLPDGRVFKVSKRDLDVVWLEDPHEMAKQNRTKKVMLEVRPVLVGGFGLAQVIYVTSVPGQPDIDK